MVAGCRSARHLWPAYARTRRSDSFWSWFAIGSGVAIRSETGYIHAQTQGLKGFSALLHDEDAKMVPDHAATFNLTSAAKLSFAPMMDLILPHRIGLPV